MNNKTQLIIALLAMHIPFLSHAAVSPEEAGKLKTTLTPMGAERSGNAEGTIPEWTGGYTEVKNYKPGDIRPDYFASDAILYTITADNLDQYADKLSEGMKGLFKKYPDFKMNVYPTRRTAAATQAVYDSTFKNATTSTLVDDGFGVENDLGGVPFPIPQNGNEVMWNSIKHWQGVKTTSPSNCWVATPKGRVRLSSKGLQNSYHAYYDTEADYEGIYTYGRYVQSAPASKAGESILVHDPSSSASRRGIWQYLVGQRRVRRAPSVSFDTPDSVTSGIGFFDEAFGLFGPWDRHEYTLVGKKEIIIPYNNNKAAAAPSKELMGKNFLNPDLVRWELHRVWVVDANLAEGKRHVVAKRRYYIDEDSWNMSLQDGWDSRGQLWRSGYSLGYLAPDIPALIGDMYWGVYNLIEGGYFINAAGNDESWALKKKPELVADFFSPDALADLGSR